MTFAPNMSGSTRPTTPIRITEPPVSSRLPPLHRGQLRGRARIAGHVVAFYEGLQLRVPAGIELHAPRGELAEPVAERLHELEGVAQEESAEYPAMVVLELDHRDAVPGEQAARPAQDGQVVSLGVDLDQGKPGEPRS